MPSRARIDAGRSVGTLAKGKKFEEACQKCAQNSVKHRLFSKTLVLANESPELFESTRKTYYDLWKPENEFEADLVNDMVAAPWCLNRIMMVETEALDLRHASMNHSGELKKEFDVILEPTRLVIAYAKKTNESATLANLSCYELATPASFAKPRPNSAGSKKIARPAEPKPPKKRSRANQSQFVRTRVTSRWDQSRFRKTRFCQTRVTPSGCRFQSPATYCKHPNPAKDPPPCS